MSIVIKTEKVLSPGGSECYKVLKVSGMKDYDHVPDEYGGGYPCALMETSGEAFYVWDKPFQPHHMTEIGKVYTKEGFFERLQIIRAAGERLHQINKKLKWSGEETFTI